MVDIMERATAKKPARKRQATSDSASESPKARNLSVPRHMLRMINELREASPVRTDAMRPAWQNIAVEALRLGLLEIARREGVTLTPRPEKGELS